jgi:hypothetical protein
MAMLFDKSRSTVNEHILNVFAEGELKEENTVRKIGNSDFSINPTNLYEAIWNNYQSLEKKSFHINFFLVIQNNFVLLQMIIKVKYSINV